MDSTQKISDVIPHLSHLFFEAPDHAGKTSAIYMALGDKRFSAGGFLRCRIKDGKHVLLSPARAASIEMPVGTSEDSAEKLITEAQDCGFAVFDEPTAELLPALISVMGYVPCIGAIKSPADPVITEAIFENPDVVVLKHQSFEQMYLEATTWVTARSEELRQQLLERAVQKSWDRDYLKAGSKRR